MRRFARAPAIDPAAVLQLVALPRLADREAGQQREQDDEQDAVGPISFLAGMTGSTSSQRSCARSTSSMNSRTAPRPPPAVLTQSTRSRTSGAASAGAADSPARAKHRQIEQVVSHERDRAVTQARLAQDSLVRVQLARHALHHDAHRRAARRAGAWRADVRADSSPTVSPARCAQTMRGAVADVKALRLRSVRVHHDRRRR